MEKLQGYPHSVLFSRPTPDPLFMSYCIGVPSHPTWKPAAVYTFISFLPLALTLPSPNSCLTWEII